MALVNAEYAGSVKASLKFSRDVLSIFLAHAIMCAWKGSIFVGSGTLVISSMNVHTAKLELQFSGLVRSLQMRSLTMSLRLYLGSRHKE